MAAVQDAGVSTSLPQVLTAPALASPNFSAYLLAALFFPFTYIFRIFLRATRPQPPIAPVPDLISSPAESPSATPISPATDLGTLSTEEEKPAEIAQDAVVPVSLPYVPASPSMLAQLVSPNSTRPQSPIPPDPNPVPFLAESPATAPVPPAADLGAHGTEGNQLTEIVQDAVAPTSLPQVPDSPSTPTQLEPHPQSSIPTKTDPVSSVDELPAATPILPDVDLGARSAKGDEPAAIAQFAVVPTSLPQVLESPSMLAQLASSNETRPQSPTPLNPDPVPSLGPESPAATSTPSVTDLGTHSAEGDTPAQISHDPIVPTVLPQVLALALVSGALATCPQLPIIPVPDPVPSLDPSSSTTPTPTDKDLNTCSAEGDKPETMVQDAVMPASLPQVLASSSVPAELASSELSPSLAPPIPLVTMAPSSSNGMKDLGLAVQELLAAVERYGANLFQPLAAALDGFVMLSDNLKVRIHCFA